MDQTEEDRINRLLLESDSEEEIIHNESDDGDEDYLEVSDHNTDTDQSADEDVDPRPIPIYDVGRNSNYILGKDNYTKWYLCQPAQSV